MRPEDAERREIGSKRGLEGRENRLCGLKCWSECFRTIVGGDLEGIDGVFFNGLLSGRKWSIDQRSIDHGLHRYSVVPVQHQPWQEPGRYFFKVAVPEQTHDVMALP